MAKRESTDELLAVLRRAEAPATRTQAIRESFPASTPKTDSHALPPSLPGVVNATSLNAPLGSSQSSASSGSDNALTQQLQQLTTQLGQLQTSNQSLIDAGNQNTQALLENTLAKAQGSGGSTLGTIASTAESLLGGGLSLAPLITGLASLFGGGSSTPAPLTPFVLPQSIQFQGGITGPAGQTVSPVDQNQNGQLRPYSSTSQTAATQVTVQVQAIDSQSFLDHSQDIADAVRQALLNGSPLNDVISELS
jgi:hypothetical protein